MLAGPCRHCKLSEVQTSSDKARQVGLRSLRTCNDVLRRAGIHDPQTDTIQIPNESPRLFVLNEVHVAFPEKGAGEKIGELGQGLIEVIKRLQRIGRGGGCSVRSVVD